MLRTARKAAGALYVVANFASRALAPVGRLAISHIILPAYKFGVTTRLRIQRLALPARGFVIFLVSNRYLFHTALGLMAIVTFLANATAARQAHAQDVGQNSVLFALATDQKAEVVEESVQPENFSKDVHYLGSSSLLYVPNVDFDYDPSLDEINPPSLAVPGTIAANPMEETVSNSVAPRTKTDIYIVKENDTISSIAQAFSVNVGTILWNNNLAEKQYIRPGDSLRIPPVSGMLVTVKKGDTASKLATTYGADEVDVLAYNDLSSNSQLTLGSEIVIPGGRPPTPVQEHAIVAVRKVSPVPIKERPVPVTVAVASQEPATSQDVTSDGGIADDVMDVSTTFKPDDMDTTNLPRTRLLWPTSSHVITQYYGWRHTGIDFDGDFSSPIYAAEDGVIEKAGWNSSGYGLMILISNKANGLTTRYGHSSKLYVKEGDVVHQGQVIAMVGTTGRSTGTHLHFEVYVNGKRTNPLAYIK